MKNDQFNEIVTEQLDRIQATLVNKGQEYATDADRLHNFKQAANMQGITSREALSGMMVKHTVSVYDMIGGPTGAFTLEQWNEKITDHLTYLVLLKAVIIEEQGYDTPDEERNNVELQELRDKLSPSFQSNVTFQEIERSPFEPQDPEDPSTTPVTLV